jgi:hypothetical protein
MDDWYRVSYTDVKAMRGGTPAFHLKIKSYILQGAVLMMASAYGGLRALLKNAYPGTIESIRISLNLCKLEHKWKAERFVSWDKSEKYILTTLKEIFPDMEIHTGYKYIQLNYSDTQKSLELDFFIPKVSLALEYHGQQHYSNTGFFSDPPFQRDQQKIEKCKEAGVINLTSTANSQYSRINIDHNTLLVG